MATTPPDTDGLCHVIYSMPLDEGSYPYWWCRTVRAQTRTRTNNPPTCLACILLRARRSV